MIRPPVAFARDLPRALALAAMGSLLAATPAAHAEPTGVGPTGFTVSFHHELKAPPAQAFEQVGHVERWWNAEHSWSGNAANLSMGLQAGNCFWERWAGGSVEHGRVIMVMKDSLVRIDAALGPLQGLAVKGILTIALKPLDGGRTAMDVTYRVSGGSPDAGLEKLAPAVDGVIGEQAARLARLVDTGRP